MSDQIIAAIALVIALPIGIIFYRTFMARGSRKQRFIEKAKKSGHVTLGISDSVKILNSMDSSYHEELREQTAVVKYRYTVNGVTYYKKMSFQSPGMLSVDYPTRVQVYYDPRNPHKAYCPNEATKGKQRNIGCWLTIVLEALVLFVMINVLKILLG